jgi:Mlc titration factor MtfA (ptsG expression regulator)
MKDLDYIKSILEEEFSYYRKLSNVEKNRFAFRVKEFKKNKLIEGRKDFVVDERVEILVSATSIQLTFGLNEYLLNYFDRILIYPQKYYSKYDNHYHVGEVNSAGQVVLSWEDFYVGILVDNDSKNVGLHEFAHALMISDGLNQKLDFFFSAYYREWEDAAINYLESHQQGSGFFRNYALTNLQEFFAVGVEYFFEKTSEFRRQEPVLFVHFCILLNQIPDQSINHIYKLENSIDYSSGQGVWKKINTSESKFSLISKIIFGVSCCLIYWLVNGEIENETVKYIYWFLGIVYFMGFVFSITTRPLDEITIFYYSDRVVLSKRLKIVKEIFFSSLNHIEYLKEEYAEDPTLYYIVFHYKNGETYTTDKFGNKDIVDMEILDYIYNKLEIFALRNGDAVLSKLKL